MQLRNDYPFSAVDHKSTFWRHVGYVTQEHVLHNCLEVNMFLVITGQSQLGFERYAVGQAPLHTFLYGIARWVYVIIQEFKYKNVSRVRDREIFLEHLIKSFIHTILRSCFQLEKLLEGLYLYFKQIRVRRGEFNFAEAHSFIFSVDYLTV